MCLLKLFVIGAVLIVSCTGNNSQVKPHFFLQFNNVGTFLLGGIGLLTLVLFFIAMKKYVHKYLKKNTSEEQEIIQTIGHAILLFKEWRKHVYSGKIQNIQYILCYLNDHEVELSPKERFTIAGDLLALWEALPSMKLFGIFYENLLKLTKKFPSIYMEVFIVSWSKRTEKEIKEAIHNLKSLPPEEYKYNEWFETTQKTASLWTTQDPYDFPDWFKNALIDLTKSNPFFPVIENLIGQAILAEQDFEDTLNSSAALVILNDQEVFIHCLKIAIKKKQYSLYYPTIRKAIDILKKPWGDDNQERVEKAMALVLAIYNEGFYPSLKEVILHAEKRTRPDTWNSLSIDWSTYCREFLESGEYKREEIRQSLKLFGPVLVPAARILVQQEKHDHILKRGALVYISEAMLISDSNKISIPQMNIVKKYYKKVKNLPQSLFILDNTIKKKRSYASPKKDFSQERLNAQNTTLLRSLCLLENRDADRWCYGEAYTTLMILNRDLYKSGKANKKELPIDIVIIADVLFKEHLRSIMQNLMRVKSQGLSEERIILSLHEPIEALRHFSSDLRIPKVLQLLRNLDETGLEQVIQAIDECGISQEKYPFPKNLEEVRNIARYWFLRRLLYENRHQDCETIRWHLEHSDIVNNGAKREIVSHLQTVGGTILNSLRKAKHLNIFLLTILSLMFFTPQLMSYQKNSQSKPKEVEKNIKHPSSIKTNNVVPTSKVPHQKKVTESSPLLDKNTVDSNGFSDIKIYSPGLISIYKSEETITFIVGIDRLKTLLFWCIILVCITVLAYVTYKVVHYFTSLRLAKQQNKLTIEQALSILETEPWVSKEGVDEIVNTHVLEALATLTDIQPMEFSEKSKQSIRLRIFSAWRKKDLLNVLDEIGTVLVRCSLFIETLTEVLMSDCPGYISTFKLGVNKKDLISRAIDHLQKLGAIKKSSHEQGAFETAINHCIIRCRTKTYKEFDRNHFFFFISKIGWQILMPVMRIMVERECSMIKKEGNTQPDRHSFILRSGLISMFAIAVERVPTQSQNIENQKLLRTAYRVFSIAETNYPHCHLEADKTLILLNKRVPNANTVFQSLFYAIDNRLQNSTKRTFRDGSTIINNAIDFLETQNVLASITSIVPRMNVKELEKIYSIHQESIQRLKNLKKTELFYWQNKAKIMIAEMLLAAIEQKTLDVITWLKTIPLFFAYDKLAQWAAHTVLHIHDTGYSDENSEESHAILNAILGDEQHNVDKGLKDIIDVMYYTKDFSDTKNLSQEIQMAIKFLSFWREIKKLPHSSKTMKIIELIWVHIPQDIRQPITNYYSNCSIGKQIAQLLKEQYRKQEKILKLQQCCTLLPQEEKTPIKNDSIGAVQQNEEDILITIVGKDMYQYLITVFQEIEQPNIGTKDTDINEFILYLDFALHYLRMDRTNQEIIAGVIAHIPSKEFETTLDYYAGLPLMKNLVYEFNEYS